MSAWWWLPIGWALGVLVLLALARAAGRKMPSPTGETYVCSAHRFQAKAGGTVVDCRCRPQGPGPVVRSGGVAMSWPVVVVLALVAVTIGALIGHLLLVLGIA